MLERKDAELVDSYFERLHERRQLVKRFQRHQNPGSEHKVWPESGAVALWKTSENYLSVGGRFVEFSEALDPNINKKNASRIPSPLLATIRCLARKPGSLLIFNSVLSRHQNHKIWRTLEAQIGELDEAFIAAKKNENSWKIVMKIAAVIAHRLRYPRLPFRENTILRRFANRLYPGFTKSKLWKWFEGLELFVRSLTHLKYPVFQSENAYMFQSLTKSLTKDETGLCRHYSFLMHCLFDTYKRATQDDQKTHILSITGNPTFSGYGLHVWNWYVNEEENLIIPFDLTNADWQMDRNGAASLSNKGLSASTHSNCSAFLNTIFAADEDVLPFEIVATLLPALIRPQTARGQSLLLRLACQPVSSKVRERIERFLSSQSLQRHLPNWQSVIETAKKNYLVTANPERQSLLLDTII